MNCIDVFVTTPVLTPELLKKVPGCEEDWVVLARHLSDHDMDETELNLHTERMEAALIAMGQNPDHFVYNTFNKRREP